MEENKEFPLPEEDLKLIPASDLPREPEELLPESEEQVDITELTMEPIPEADVLPEEESFPAEEEAMVEDHISEEMVAAEEIPSPEEAEPFEALPSDADPISEEPSAGEEVPAEELPAEESPARTGEDFMARIPDVELDYPAEDPASAKTIEDIEAMLDKPVDEDFQNREPDPEFESSFTVPAAEAKPQEHERPTRKGRPKRQKGEGLLGIPNILATFVWLALIVVIGVTAGRMLWVCAADVLAFGREDKAVTITIYEADTMEDIVDKLHSNGLIRYKSLFNLYASISDAEEDIKPGIYDLNTRYDYHALVNFMSPKSSREVVELTIPEGYTCQQIFDLLEEYRVCTAVDAAAYAANGELNDYWFLAGLERGTENCLEGYLFPDTYEFYKNSTPREALQRMLNNFEIKFSEEMKAQLDTLNGSLTDDYTARDIVIVASLIERESAHPEESPRVAGVIYNRLFNWGNNPKLLNIDASIVYAQGGNAEHIDTALDHPYNTYLYPGLTPGPIANPGLASLKAALNPETHNYFYYVLNPETGRHQFSTTNEEHNNWIRQFYN